ncbi:hypothetical protein [Tsukamurella sp. 1534]|uniref:hypothetical protein n=1 Tax=Tsukamurella sp. 1534 TaxID=1151061 RepID=UPI00031064C2|nr:hypothetical protein [Tsukamurella sp. 1534]
MSDERISVAELLARGGGGDKPAQGGRRRRHRGGENSVTVAELTGEIPVVRDEEQPADQQSQAAPQEAQQAPAEQAQAAQQQPTAQQPAAPQEAYEEQAPQAQAQPVSEQPATEQAPAEQASAEQPAEEDEDDAPTTSSFLAAAVQTARSDDETGQAEVVEAEVVDETAQAPQAAAQDAYGAAQAAAPEADAEHHTNEKHVEANYAWSQWDDVNAAGAAPGMATADFNTAQVRERQARFAEPPAEDTVDVKPVGDVPAAPDTAALSAQQIDDARDGGTAEQAPAFLAGDDAQDAEPAKTEAAEKGGGKSWLLLAGEVILGIAAGAGLFYGFFKLWNWGGGTLTIALTVVLAFVVIIGIVTFTHYLRKTTDYLTLGLALLVGLVITFGPLVMSLAQS